MAQHLYYYLAVSLLLFVVSLHLVWQKRQTLALTSVSYRTFLLVPWRITTFVLAFFGIVLLAPYTGDPTWDYFDASFMAVLTYLTAPWCVGLIYRELKARRFTVAFYIAVCLWMFSTSWSYDLYLVIRDGGYPITWRSNIFASSILYFCAGLFWSLEYRAGRGVTFSFLENDWFSDEDQSFGRVILYGLPFMILVSVLMLTFAFNWF